jgi:alcohol dehydrogenase class IV
MSQRAFKASSFNCRLYFGHEVIDNNLREAVDRVGAKRAFVICSRSVNRRTDTVTRIAVALGERFAGVYDGIEKDSTYASVVAATAAAKEAGAGLLIATGGGSVIVATRVVAVYLGEAGDPFELMTQYPDGKAAYSPRLMAAKLPIINIPTTPTSAMNRGGSGLKNPDLDHRMEYFDPKTRPKAVLLDDAALLSAPADLIRSTSTTVFANLVGSQSEVDMNPLARGDQDQAFALAYPAYRRLMHDLKDPQPRMHLALAAYLQNRAEDDGKRRFVTNVFAGNYAVSTALHLRYPAVGQGESTSVIQATAIRIADHVADSAPPRQVAQALKVWSEGMEGPAAAEAVADELERIYVSTGVPTRLSDLAIEREDLILIARETVKNFNANAGARSAGEQIEASMRLLEAAW